jgi:ribosome maturation factor RimP
VRRRDFERFAGRPVALRGREALVGEQRHVQGELLGVSGEGAAEVIRLRLPSGDEVAVPRARITRAHLVYRWGE